VLNKVPLKGQPCLQRDPCCHASVERVLLLHLGWLLGGRDNPCCAQSALLGSQGSIPPRTGIR